MSTKLMEQQLTELQQRVAKLEAKSEAPTKATWRAVIGFAKDDALFSEAMKLGAEWRRNS
jgi:hypothetical protein